MPTYKFEAARGPLILSSFSLKYVFLAFIGFPAIGVVSAFVIGVLIHPNLMSNYDWGCRKVYLPSVSRVLNFPLERTAWNFLALTSVPFQFFVLIRQYLLTETSSKFLQFLRFILLSSSGFQSLFLTLLATVGERENGNFHVAFFCGFTTSTLINYTTFTILMKLLNPNKEEQKHTIFRVKLLTTLLIALPVIFIAFILHNGYCVAGSYEIFAIFEYITCVLIFTFQISNSYLFSSDSQRIFVCHRKAILSPVRL